LVLSSLVFSFLGVKDIRSNFSEATKNCVNLTETCRLTKKMADPTFEILN